MTNFTDLNLIQMCLYLVILGIMVMGISFIMETYKKKIRKDNTTKYELWFIGGVLSIIATYGIIHLGMFHPIFSIIGAEPIVDKAILCMVIFVGQFQADMKLLKSLIKTSATTLLKKGGLPEEQIKMVLETLLENKD